MIAKLKDVCEFIVDCPHTTAQDEGQGYPLIRTPNIGKGRFDLDGVHRVSEDIYKKRNLRATPQDNDLIFAREAPAGNAAIIKNGNKFCLGQRTVLIRPNPQLVCPDFLTYFLLAPQQQYGLLGTANGATVAHVNLPTIRELEIDIPSLEEQCHIANILSAYDDLIENNQKQIKLLEEAAQRLYKEWFIDLHFPGWENTTITDSVPEGWEQKTIADVSSVLRRGISPKYNDAAEITVINQKCIRQTIVDMSESRKQEKKFPDELTLLDSDTVICSTGAGTLGRVGQIFGDYPNTTLDSHVTLVRASDRCGKQYMFHTLKFNQTRLMGMGQGSTNQLELNRSVIQQTELLFPPEETVAQFERIAQPIHDRITALNRQSIFLKETRDRLLPKLMSGELEV